MIIAVRGGNDSVMKTSIGLRSRSLSCRSIVYLYIRLPFSTDCVFVRCFSFLDLIESTDLLVIWLRRVFVCVYFVRQRALILMVKGQRRHSTRRAAQTPPRITYIHTNNQIFVVCLFVFVDIYTHTNMYWCGLLWWWANEAALRRSGRQQISDLWSAIPPPQPHQISGLCARVWSWLKLIYVGSDWLRETEFLCRSLVVWILIWLYDYMLGILELEKIVNFIYTQELKIIIFFRFQVANNPCANLLNAHFRLEGHPNVNKLVKVIQGAHQTYMIFQPSHVSVSKMITVFWQYYNIV